MGCGNACWKQERGDSLFEPQIPLSRFTIRNKVDYRGYQFKFDKSLMKRINGELCIFNTIEIIKRYQPKYWIIENPAHGRIWEYIEKIIGFALPFENPSRYNNYGYPVSKPTRFSGNIELSLKNEIIPNEVDFKDFSSSYNERSNIPQNLLLDIFQTILNQFEKDNQT